MKYLTNFLIAAFIAAITPIAVFGFDIVDMLISHDQRLPLLIAIAGGIANIYLLLPPKWQRPAQWPVYLFGRICRSPLFWIEIPKFWKWKGFEGDLWLIFWGAMIIHSWHFVYIGLIVIIINNAVKAQRAGDAIS